MAHSVKDAIKHFKKHDPVLYQVAIKLDVPELTPRGDHFYSLVRAITNQQLSGKAADTIFGRVLKLLPKEKLDPKEILKLTDDTLRTAGLSYGKISYLKDLSERTVNKKIPYNKLDALTEEEVILELTKIKGIGVWSAEMFLMFSLCRPDVFSYGDLGLKKGIQKIYNMKEHPTPKQAERLSKKWSPYRTYASKILWQSLDKKSINTTNTTNATNIK